MLRAEVVDCDGPGAVGIEANVLDLGCEVDHWEDFIGVVFQVLLHGLMPGE